MRYNLINMVTNVKKSVSAEIFSRDNYNKFSVFLTLPFYLLFLLGIRLGWFVLPENQIARIIVLFSVPTLLIFLFFTSFKKVFPQPIGDAIQALVWITIISAGNTYWGGMIRIDGPLFLGNVLLIPLFSLLLDTFLPYFITIIVSSLLLLEFIVSAPTFSFLAAIDIFFKIIIVIMIGNISSSLIKRVLSEMQISEELASAYRELKRLDKAKTEFISIASHQLRTPLTAIKGYLSLIQEGSYGKFSPKMKRPIDNIYISSERLIKLVNDLLNISRLEAGKIKLKIEKLSLEDIIDSVVEELKNLAEKKKLTIIWERPEEPLPQIMADRENIRQVVLNLIDNAIRYTQEGKVTVECSADKNVYRMKVKDTGEGMNKEELSKLFKRFSRGSGGQRTWTEGTGLGLYIAKKFVDMYKGNLWAESRGKGKGSAFYLELPIHH